MYAYTQSFIETAFSDEFLFWQNIWPDLSQSTSITAPFKNFVNLFSDCKLSLSRGSVGPEGDPHPGGSGPDPWTEGISRLRQLSAHQMCRLHTEITAIFVLMWFEPCLPPGFVTVGAIFPDCGTAGRVVTPQTHTQHLCVCGNPQLSSPWGLFPVLPVVEADCSYLI